jgi:hypothetical protein
MNNNNRQTCFPSSDETIQLVTNLQTNNKKSDNMLTHKMLTEHRLMRWCALILALSTLIIIWRYITILILSIWLSSICRPMLEWLVSHL